jgi:hypothetical protein
MESLPLAPGGWPTRSCELSRYFDRDAGLGQGSDGIVAEEGLCDDLKGRLRTHT